MTLAERLRRDLARFQPNELLPGDDVPAVSTAVAAAVLIAITDRPEPGVILTLRRADMRTHGGQIAFPGGRVDEGEHAVQAALREAMEELALDPAQADIVGPLESYCTVTGYVVTPIVAVVPPDLPLSPHEDEVADWFEAPLAFLLDPANHARERVLFEGRQRHYYRIDWNGRNIWGATAGMLVNLSRKLAWS